MAFLRRMLHAAQLMGLDPVRFAKAMVNVPRFLNELQAYREADDGFFPMTLFPIVSDYHAQAEG